MATEVRIPDLGESVSEGSIARWIRQDGDAVDVDDPLIELETDKATMELPAEVGGRLEIVVPEGETVRVGDVIARIHEGEAGKASPDAEDDRPEKEEAAESPKDEAPRSSKDEAATSPKKEPDRSPKDEPKEPARAPKRPAAESAPQEDSDEALPLSPAVRRLVEQHGLDPRDIRGTGKGGRLLKEDVLAHIAPSKERKEPRSAAKESEREEPAPAEEPERETPPARGRSEGEPAPPRSAGPAEERTRMSRLRRRIAERLVEAQRTAAILTTFNEVDCGAIMELRKRYKESFEKRHGVGLGFMSLFSRAVIQALEDVPVVNSMIDGEEVVHYRDVHLGLAVSTDRGLIVPVVREANRMSIAELERAIGEIAVKARDGKIMPDDLAGGTFTISNGGVFGSLLSTPILNPPQSGILGMHKIEKRPVVVDDEIVVRPMMYVALSYDHRLVDGREAVTFLVRMKERLEDPARMLLEV